MFSLICDRGVHRTELDHLGQISGDETPVGGAARGADIRAVPVTSRDRGTQGLDQPSRAA